MNPKIGIPRNNLFRFTIVLVLCWAMIGWADSWESIQREAGRVRSLRADFIQKKNLEILSDPLISKGKLFFKAPDSLRLEYTSPVRSIILVHENETKRFTQGEDGLTRDSGAQISAMRYVIDEISLWFQGKFKESTHFEASLKPGKRILLSPKNQSIMSAIENIELHLSDEPGLLEKAIIFENQKSRTELIFQNASLNSSFNETLFLEANTSQH